MFSICNCAVIIVILIISAVAYLAEAIWNAAHVDRLIIGGVSDDPLVTYIRQYEAAPKEDLILHYSHIDNMCDYIANDGLITTNCHIGQRKLLLTEIQFLSYFTDIGADAPTELIMYIGSAPGEHLTIIKDMFPLTAADGTSKRKYLLIDPNYQLIDDKVKYIYMDPDVVSSNARGIYNLYRKSQSSHQRRAAKALEWVEFINPENQSSVAAPNVMNVVQIDRPDYMRGTKTRFYDNPEWASDLMSIMYNDSCDIFIIQDYMSIELSNRLKECKDSPTNPFKRLLFISDIRTNLFKPAPTDLDIMYNDCIQMICLNDLRPDYSMLKFHPPYSNNDRYVKECEAAGASGDSTNPMYSLILKYIHKYNKISGRDMFRDYSQSKYYHYDNHLITIQPWATPSSSEARILISKKALDESNWRNYDRVEWENKFKYVKLYRMYWYNDLFDLVNVRRKSGYCGCMDCIIEQVVILIYKKRIIDHVDIDPKTISYSGLKDLVNVDVIEYIDNMYSHINSFSRWDLRDNKSKKCSDHGWNSRQRHESSGGEDNRLYVAYSAGGVIYDSAGQVVERFKSHPGLYLKALSNHSNLKK